jgi:hypothetical protein
MDLPRVTFTARPRDPAPGADPTALAIRFQSRPLATFECQFGQAVLAVVACDPATPGTGEYTPAALAEGTYQFKVRATDASDTGPWATLGFAVDNTAPTLSLDPNAPSTAVGGAIRLGFSANEIGTAFECRIDGGEFQRCSSPKSYAGLALGEHTVEVRGTDAAGNAATNTLTWDFTSVPAPVQPDTSTGQAPPVIPVVPTLGAPAPGRSAVPAPAAPAAPIAVQASLREPRQAIGVPCVAVSPSRQRARFRLSGIDALISFRAPSQARYAKFTLRRSSSRGRSAGVVETVGYAKVRVAGSGHTTRVALTRGQRSRVRSGRLRLAISYGTCRTQVGEWEWLTTSIREGSNR